ncbi:MAG: hypothetical protein AAGE38_01345 [Pseudomonadota bacterium]
MLQTIGNASLLGLLAMGALAWGFARVLDGPAWSGRAILLVIVLIAFFAQIALPLDAPFRQSTGGAVIAVLCIAAAAVPVLGYRWILRRLRKPVPPAAHPTGFVVIPEDAALARDTAARLDQPIEEAQVFSVAYRDDHGTIQATLRLHVIDGVAHLQNIWTAPDSDLTGALLETAAQAARERRAHTLLVAPQAPDRDSWLQAQGFTQARGVPVMIKPIQ